MNSHRSNTSKNVKKPHNKTLKRSINHINESMSFENTTYANDVNSKTVDIHLLKADLSSKITREGIIGSKGKDKIYEASSLTFGSTIKLIEFRPNSMSKDYITLSNNKENFDATENEDSNKGTLFKLIPSVTHYSIFKKLNNMMSNLNYEDLEYKREDNINNYKENIGREIRYGEPFHLYDVSSNMFVTYSQENGDEGMILSLKLDDYPNKESLFNFESAFIIDKRKEGYIYITDIIHLALFGQPKPTYLCRPKQCRENLLAKFLKHRHSLALSTTHSLIMKIECINLCTIQEGAIADNTTIKRCRIILK